MLVIKYRAIFFTISGLLMAASIFGFFKYGLNLGIDFTGGSLLEVEYTVDRPDVETIKNNIASISSINFGDVSVQPSGERGAIVRLRTIDENEKQVLKAAMANGLTVGTSTASTTAGVLVEKNFTAIGPTIGKELANKGLVAIVIVLLVILLFIAFSFRGISARQGGINGWKYGAIALVALSHDVIIPTGLFVYLGHFYGTEIGALFLTALLAIMGISIADTIVIFDRIRENLRRKISNSFEETVGISLNETFVRSFNTSMTVILALGSLYYFGEATTKDFALALISGMIVGTYSSIFIASPLLVVWEKIGRK